MSKTTDYRLRLQTTANELIAPYVIVALLIVLVCESSYGDEPQIFDYRVVNVYPHDAAAFTQGLFFRNGWLYESTGQYGSSSIRKVRLEDGRVAQRHDLEDRYFGEGIVDWRDSLVAVTWRSGQGFVLSIDDFVPRERFAYTGEGWGLTRNDSHLILSDGTEVLRFLNPESFEVEHTVTVTLDGKPVRNLNELEWVEDELLSNVWRTDWVLKIDPQTGVVTGLIDLSGLLSPEEKRGADVLNGIAYDSGNDRLFVTGKRWSKLFEIETFKRPSD